MSRQQLEIRDFKDGLRIKARQRRSLVQGIFSAVIAASFVVLILARFVSLPILILIVVLAAGLGFAQVLREKVAELHVTNLELTTHGYFGSDYRGTRSVPRADIRWLEYQEDRGGIETSYHPAGLYAVLRSGDACVLPNVNDQQSGEIIEAIAKRFPEFAKQWHSDSPFGEHFTTLGLNQPKSDPITDPNRH